MSGPLMVRRAREDEIGAVAGILHDAFAHEAGLNYWLRQGARKEPARRRFFDAAVRQGVHPKRELWLAEAEGEALGAAIWLEPGRKAYDFTMLQQLAMAPLLWSIAGVSGALRGMKLGEQLDALHPHAPHAHLVFLGVAGAAQGRGIGSAMLKTTLARLDAAGVAGLLEATTERNIALYQRHGFETVEHLRARDVHVRIMWRAARSTTS